MHQPNTSTHTGTATVPSQALCLVSCVSRKRTTSCRARELYTSPWFSKARAHVEQLGATWFILSAAHGLLEPDRRIAPYDVTLRRMTAEARRAWAARVLGELEPHLRGKRRVVMFAGQRYRQYLVPLLEARGHSIAVPLAGLAIGKQLAWFNAHTGVTP